MKLVRNLRSALILASLVVVECVVLRLKHSKLGEIEERL
jgi:hypothetical protein